MVNSGHGFFMMKRYRFLFARFTVPRYYYGFPLLLRGLLISFMPIVFANFAARQIMFTGLVLVVFLLVQAWWQPWRLLAPNLLDSIVCAGLVLILLGGGVIVGGGERDKDVLLSDMQSLFVLAIVGLILPFVFAIAFVFYRRFFPQRYCAFLSHHKGGCAVGARLMKMELSGRVAGRVFLDSDELDDLENVLDIVRCMSKALVILLTADTLWRPWCAGEIAMGFLNKTPTILVAYDEYVNPADKDLTVEALLDRFGHEAWALVSVQGVSLQNVGDAYVEIQRGTKIDVKRLGYNTAGAGAFAAATAEVAAKLKGYESSDETHLDQTHRQAGALSADVTVMGDNTNGEAVSTAQVITSMARQVLQMQVLMILDEQDVIFVGQPRCVLVSFTQGVVTSHSFATTVIAFRKAWKSSPIVTVQSPDFIFPTKTLLEKNVYPHLAKATGYDLQTVRDAYGPLFSILAFRFGPSGNIAVMTAEVRMVANRISSQVGQNLASVVEEPVVV